MDEYLEVLGLNNLFTKNTAPGTEAWLNQLKIVSSQFYDNFIVTPKGKREREIQAPKNSLKEIQREILEELNRLPRHPNLYGLKGTSFIDNAKRHEGAKSILKVDLDKFYPSCTLKQVQENVEDDKVLSELNKYSLFLFWIPQKIMNPLEASLPTGAPTSGIVANLVLTPLDYRLEKLTKECGGIYTRYLDDMTFSFSYEVTEFGRLLFFKEVKELITEKGWSLNYKKSKWINSNNDPVVVTGVDIRNEPKVTRRYIVKKLRPQIDKEARALCPIKRGMRPDFWKKNPRNFKSRKDIINSLSSKLKGELNYVREINEKQYEELIEYMFKRFSVVEPNLTSDIDANINLLINYYYNVYFIWFVSQGVFKERLVEEIKREYNKLADDIPPEARTIIAFANCLR